MYIQTAFWRKAKTMPVMGRRQQAAFVWLLIIYKVVLRAVVSMYITNITTVSTLCMKELKTREFK